jgi:pimeloyl-ACP methyl ester carboxylesterase
MRSTVVELVFLHALPLDGSMWRGQMDLLPGRTHAPTLYGFGDQIEDWASEALSVVTGDRLIVVGCSVGGSCALEVARMAPDRVAALVLIGTKAGHRREPALHTRVSEVLRGEGMEAAWDLLWAPLLSSLARADAIAVAKSIALRQSTEDVLRGVDVFHTRPDRSIALSTLQCQVIVVRGAEDIAPGPKTSAAQARSAPQGTLHIIPDCGHYVPLERPEELNAILRGVIAAVS